jgi:hypothetical protein
LNKQTVTWGYAGVVVVMLLYLASVAPAAAASPITLTSPNAVKGGEFGISVSVNKTVAVGAPLENDGSLAKAGHAYLFSAKTGSLLLSLTSPNAQAGGEFGFFVVLSDYLVVSAQHETVGAITQAGRVYVYSSSTGALLQTLTSPNSQKSGVFGSSIDADGQLVAVGAAGESVGGKAGAGRVYLFDGKTGALVHTFSSPNSQAKGVFGTWVALSSSYLVVGAVGETVSGDAAAGRVYVYNAQTYALITTIVSPNVQAGAKLGWELGIKGGLVLATAPYETVAGLADGGHAYAFNPTTGALVYTLTSPNEKADGEFGFSATEDSASFVIGAPGEASGGHAYAFSISTGLRTSTLANAGGGAFGDSVAGLGKLIIVGAPKQTASGFSTAGHAFIF